MGDLTLRIRANFDKAQEAFEELAESSQETREQMEKFAASLSGREVDDFNNKQKRLQASLMGTRGETAALEQSSRNYQREIERLIRSGLSPNSEAVQRLRNEQQQLEKRINSSRKAQERKTKAMKAAKVAVKAAAAAVVAAGVGLFALTKRVAESNNKILNNSRMVGLSVEAFQELDYAMRMSGIENGKYMLDRLNRSVIDVRNETGTLTKFLREHDEQLLRQLQNVENNEQAFYLLMDTISGMPNELDRTELAMAAFGRNGTQMVLAAEQGVEGINALRNELRAFGVVNQENAENAAKFNDAMTRLRTAFNGIAQEIASRLKPAFTIVINALTEVIKRWEDWVTFGRQGLARVQFAVLYAASVLRESFTVALNAVRLAMISVYDFIVGNIVRAIGELLSIVTRIPIIGRYFDNVAKAVSNTGRAIRELREETSASSREAIAYARERQDAQAEELRANLAAIDEEARARRAELAERRKTITEFENSRVDIIRESLNEIIALQDEANKKMEEGAEKTAEAMLKSYSIFFGGLSSLLGVAGRDNRAFFLLSRNMALVQAGINTALAITKALATGGIPKAIGVGLKGAAQKAKIVSSMIPSAETGGRFIVPQSRGVDTNLLRVNSGETVDITPRGMTNSDDGVFNFQLAVDGQVFAEIMNVQARRGNLNTLQLAGNL